MYLKQEFDLVTEKVDPLPLPKATGRKSRQHMQMHMQMSVLRRGKFGFGIFHTNIVKGWHRVAWVCTDSSPVT